MLSPNLEMPAPQSLPSGWASYCAWARAQYERDDSSVTPKIDETQEDLVAAEGHS